MGATCSLYNRLSEGLLCSIGQWQPPPDYQAEDRAEGHICFDVICRADHNPIVINDLDRTGYAGTDPNVSRYGLKTYVGVPVFWGDEAVGSLCAVFVENHVPTAAELSFMTIVAAALGVEEARWRAEKELQESEERFRTLVESAPEAIFVHKGPQFLYLNRSMQQLIGCGPDDDLVGQSCFDRLPPEYLEMVSERIKKVQTSGGPTPLCEMEFFSLDGSRVPVETTSVPIRFQGSEAVVVFVRNITERKITQKKILQMNSELEERVAQRTAELKQLNSDLEGFCYAISHEFRAPIARLEGFCEVLREMAAGADPNALVHCAGRIAAASQRLKTVIDSLLTMNRLARAEMVISRVELSQVARQIVDHLLEELQGRSVQVTIVPDIVVSGERSMLEIALENLLKNALKYTAQTPDAVIEFGMTTRAGQTVYYVRDNGVGFDMQYAKNLFQPFCRLHAEAEFEGTGIGLAMVQRIIEKHGGRIWAEAVPNRGATFFFTLGRSGGGES
jgi:PAS domain S-box-containing protein